MHIDILRRAFGERTFSATEAAGVLGIARGSGTLSRLKTAGLVEAAGRGRYRLTPASRGDAIRHRLHAERIRALLDGPVAVALDGPDAVVLWTEGRYRPPSFPGADTVHIACAARDRVLMGRVLDTLEVPWAEDGAWPKGRDLVAIVRFVDVLRRVRRGRTWVVTRREVLRIIREAPIAYADATELVA